MNIQINEIPNRPLTDLIKAIANHTKYLECDSQREPTFLMDFDIEKNEENENKIALARIPEFTVDKNSPELIIRLIRFNINYGDSENKQEV